VLAGTFSKASLVGAKTVSIYVHIHAALPWAAQHAFFVFGWLLRPVFRLLANGFAPFCCIYKETPHPAS
jgi:hypothetical protein